MVTIPQATQDHYRRMQRLQILALRASRRSWTRVDWRHLSPSWAPLVARELEPLMSGIQVQAAASGASYGALTLAEQGSWVAPEAFVDPRAFGGYAADGRSLDGLLFSPITSVKTWIADGRSASEALAMGGRALDTIVRTVVADAGRQAAGIDTASRKSVGYVRMLNPPSCSRCIVLAGRLYRWNTGFRRHPRCDCVHVQSAAGSTQAALDEGLISDPYEYFQGLPKDEQNKIFGEHEAAAIRDGGDIFQVINSKRGRQGAFTTEGTGRRGNASTVLRPGQRRMTPETIYRLNPNREDALKALRDQGYILPGGQVPTGSLQGRVEGFGQMGGGGTRKAASAAVEEARRTGVRDPRSRYTMTAAERRLNDAERRYQMVLEGRNPFASPGFGNTPDPQGLGLNTVGASRGPLTPQIAAMVETDYRRWLATGGQKFAA
ncbi:hypothetical protein [Oerskovia sp. Root22]|uniref:hypothetical protein n=1 Tax=Oerskovia sp. Root22 TaxID=1736494 RepID=UPI0006F2D854|nr:hypothetical protein [Oerskovia sp. Root22]KRC37516.1 hypothetical protein ASE15_05225 [Oerskovia sp. Root22]